MTNYSCIAVGINRYQFVEPLNYAEGDAQGLVRLLTEEMGVPRERCLLLTDGSPMVSDRPTYPNYSNISAWLDNLDNSGNHSGDSSTTQADALWFFFSGHGVHWQGEDYLLPVDSNLSDLPYRGIGATTLLHALKKQGTTKILVFLDIDRSPGLGMENPVGERFSQLAQELDISLIQSVSPQECSYERKELGRGLFATALAEALSYHRQDLTLQNLSQYLIERLPELGNHHGVPQQHPLIQLASNVNQQELLLPAKVASGVNELIPVAAAVVSNTNNTNNTNNLPNPVRYRSGVESLEPARQNTKIQPESTAIQPPSTKIQPETNNNSPAPTTTPATVVKTSEQNTSKTTVKKMAKPEGESNSALPWILGAGLLFLLMILGVFIRNLGTFLGTEQPQASTNPSPNLATASPSPVPAKINGSPQTAAPQTVPQAVPQASVTPSTAANPPAAVQPAVQPTPIANASPSGNLNRQQSNQTILENARGLLQSDRVTQFAQAIKAASQIPAGEPLYDQAQADIARWSIVIMDMAHGRAKTGDWAGAIATAQALPPINQKVSKDAQIWINRWQQFIQQREVNLQQIQKARRLLRPNQATTYRQAIETIKSIPAGQPASELVQELTNNWTAEIWQIAQVRANNGDFLGAIAAANLLPENTPTFAQAQPIVALWRQGKKSP